VAGDDLLRIIDQDWIAEPELLDAVGNLPDLPLRMRPRIVGIGPQIVHSHAMGSLNFGAQYQQEPVADGGNLVKWE
jgi:hypothetical protein